MSEGLSRKEAIAGTMNDGKFEIISYFDSL